jgi:hypothetical protein
MYHIKAKVISFPVMHIMLQRSQYLQRESHLNKHNTKNNEMGLPTKSFKKRL